MSCVYIYYNVNANRGVFRVFERTLGLRFNWE